MSGTLPDVSFREWLNSRSTVSSRFIHMGAGVRGGGGGSFESPGESLVIVADAVSRLGVGRV